jgi:hypothetical protein
MEQLVAKDARSLYQHIQLKNSLHGPQNASDKICAVNLKI